MKQITFALAKGRLAEKAMGILKDLGITCKEMEGDTRKLLFTSDDGNYRFFLSKASDVPTYVDHGVADIGIVGKDTILEENREVYEVLDLGFGKCMMTVAGEPCKKALLESGNLIRVATKYPNIAKDYFYNKKHQTVEIIKLNGSIELAPIVGLSEVIVDIAFYDEAGATRLLKKAIAAGVKFTGEQCPECKCSILIAIRFLKVAGDIGIAGRTMLHADTLVFQI